MSGSTFGGHAAVVAAEHALFAARVAAARGFVAALDGLGVAGGFRAEGVHLAWEWYRSEGRGDVRVWLRVSFGYSPDEGTAMQWEKQVSAPFRNAANESGTFAAGDLLPPRLVALLRTVARGEGAIDAALRAP